MFVLKNFDDLYLSFKFFCIFLIIAFTLFLSVSPVYADEIEDVQVEEVSDEVEGEKYDIMPMVDYIIDKTLFLNNDPVNVSSDLLSSYGNFCIVSYASGSYNHIYFKSYEFIDGTLRLNGVIRGEYLKKSFNPYSIGDFVPFLIPAFSRFDISNDPVLLGSSVSFYNGNELYFEQNIDLGSYSISFVTGYDDISVSSIKTDENGCVASLPTPSLAPNGMSFDGWYLDDEYTVKVGSSYVFSSSTTLYAKWVEGAGSVDIDLQQLDNIVGLLGYIVGFMIFFIVVILCKYIYSFFNMFF